MLIEGTAEAVLLPVLAKNTVFDGSMQNSAHWKQQFLGVTIVAVGSVDFTPYIKLLLKKNSEGVRLIDKLIVITDGDPEYTEDTDSIDEGISNRIDSLVDLGTMLDATDSLHIFSSTYTLEADFLIATENRPTFKQAFDKQHTRSATQWNEIITDGNPAEFFYKKLRKNRKYLKKRRVFTRSRHAHTEGRAMYLSPIHQGRSKNLC
jgi:putative ATP-dependent endonuclease of OLD family